MDPAKLKVTELRQQLTIRGLDTKGVKAVLIERLRAALEEETGQEIPETSVLETSTEEENNFVDNKSETDPDLSESQKQDIDQDNSQQDEDFSNQGDEFSSKIEQSSQEEIDREWNQGYAEPENAQEDPSYEENESKNNVEFDKVQAEEEQVASDSHGMDIQPCSIKEEPQDENEQQIKEEKPQGDYQEYDVKKEEQEKDIKMEDNSADVKDENQYEDRKRKRSRWSPTPQKGQGWGTSGGGWTRKDDEPDLDDNAVVLGWYDSDLNLEISKTDFLEATPMSNQGFGYIWAGCRATYGFNQGRVCYEIKLLENLDVSHLEDEPSPHVLRVGWSALSSSMLLGEEPLSYGYGGTGKSSTNCKFSNYGTTFLVGDTVTAYLDYGEIVKMSFSVNGVYQRDAFTISASELNNQPLFPHLLSKNIKFRANFGVTEPEFKVEDGYTWAAHVPEDQRVAGPRRPEKRSDCEMLMMCGLPGCGKTTWANKYVKEHPDKFYNILGTNSLIEKMKIQGLARKRNYHGRWDVLIDKCTKCLNKLLEMAARRRRNYILDQTNVYPSAQKRKMRNFGGFIRRAIIIVPTDEEFQRRCAKREAEEGKDIPDSAVLEMKANFRLPEQGEHFDEVKFIELNEEDSRPLVEQYNKEGRDAGFGQSAPFSGQGKKFRPNDRPPFRGGGSSSSGGGFRGGRPGGGGFSGGMDRRDRGSDRGPGGGRGGGFRSSGPPMKGGMDRGGRGSWQPRGGMDRGGQRSGWRDRSPPSFDRDMDNRGPGGGPWRNNRSNDRDRPYDRNQRGSGGRGGRGRDNFRDDDYGGGRGGNNFRGDMGGDFDKNSSGGFDRDDFPRGGRGGGFNSRDRNYENRDGGFRDGGGGGRGGRGRGSFDKDQRGGGGGSSRGGFERRGGDGGNFNDRRGGGRGGGGNRDGGFDRNRGGGQDRGQRDNKVNTGTNSNNQGSNNNQGQQQGWGNQGYNNQTWGQQQGFNQGSGYNQSSGFNQQATAYSQPPPGGYTQAAAGGYQQQQTQQQPQVYNQQPPTQQAAGWGQQSTWGNKGYAAGTGQQQVAPAAGVTATPTAATPAATGYNTQTYNQQTGYNQQYAQGYWGQYGQGWPMNADGTYSYPQGWQQYGYNYSQTPTPTAMATQGTGAAPAAAGMPTTAQGVTK